MGVAKGSGRSPEDFISRDVPVGHDTIWGWAAKFSPLELPVERDPASAFAEEIHLLMRQSAEVGCKVVDVAAPAALRALGVDRVPAFETSLLYMMSRA
jgi:hypothetical protein